MQGRIPQPIPSSQQQQHENVPSNPKQRKKQVHAYRSTRCGQAVPSNKIRKHRITITPTFSLPPPVKRSRPNEIAIEQIPTTSSTQIQSSSTNQPSKLYESFNDKEFHDTVFTASDGTKITTHRCVLAKYSSVFCDMFKKNTVLPCRILSNDSSSATIQAALDFMFEKRDSIIGKEAEVFKFAVEYGIRDILDVCSKYADITPSNVCEFIQIAYSNNFEELKQTCLKLLVEKKKEIDAIKFADLPKNILIDFARF